MSRNIRFLLTVRKFSAGGTPFDYVVLIREFNPKQWKSESHMRQAFLYRCRKYHPAEYADPTKKILREFS